MGTGEIYSISGGPEHINRKCPYPSRFGRFQMLNLARKLPPPERAGVAHAGKDTSRGLDTLSGDHSSRRTVQQGWCEYSLVLFLALLRYTFLRKEDTWEDAAILVVCRG
jgi:hypothetical protein